MAEVCIGVLIFVYYIVFFIPATVRNIISGLIASDTKGNGEKMMFLFQ
jgi:hypothetical protein